MEIKNPILSCIESKYALYKHKLMCIPTESQLFEDGPLNFIFRILESQKQKPNALHNNKKEKQKNPFEPPFEEHLYICELKNHHLLFNPFCISEKHLLIVTKKFEKQETLIAKKDFEAALECINAVKSLCFYNSGINSGASQPHRHFQLIPIDDSKFNYIPLEKLIFSKERKKEEIIQLEELGFINSCFIFDFDKNFLSVDHVFDSYQKIVDKLDLNEKTSYNLLLTKKWIFVVPRSKESFDNIGVNSMGYVGSFFFKTQDDLKKAIKNGPLFILQNLGFPIEKK
ncbi:ap-4-a phosphorylase ii [Anaeramoeba ignava]|uniref:Ap-4-a phosphorylase ii n=1 Tax=Anaeramoeba ignava TaxID=1746090 RepID=A0A9Q0RBV0_ANAIG|nr:ap-4-a phosphorylase ii [Anaeramoeba ignava]